MREHDENEEAVRNVEKITDSEPVKGEDLLASEEAKRQLREAKQQSKSEPQ
jgi:transcriptional regulator of met regulon